MIKKRIEDHLKEVAAKDPVFAQKMQNPEKNIDGCMRYIMMMAREELDGKAGFVDDAVVFGWATHYYDEDDVTLGLTDVITQAAHRQAAEQKVRQEAEAKAKKEAEEAEKRAKRKKADDAQMSIFDIEGVAEEEEEEEAFMLDGEEEEDE